MNIAVYPSYDVAMSPTVYEIKKIRCHDQEEQTVKKKKSLYRCNRYETREVGGSVNCLRN